MGRKKRKKGPSAAVRTPAVYPTAKCRLRLLKLERIKDFLLLEEEYIKNQEVFKPREEKDQEERTKVSKANYTQISIDRPACNIRCVPLLENVTC